MKTFYLNNLKLLQNNIFDKNDKCFTIFRVFIFKFFYFIEQQHTILVLYSESEDCCDSI